METIESFFKAVADENRLRIIGLLSAQKLCVCEIAFVLKITQPSVSKHLKKLKTAGIIGAEQDGLWTNYFLSQKVDHSKLLEQLISDLSKTSRFKADQKICKSVDRCDLC